MEASARKLEQEIERVYRAHYRQLCLVALSYVSSLELAKDIVQDFFINYWERRQQGVGIPDNFAAYAQRGVRNLAIDSLRRQAVSARRQSDFESETLAGAALEEGIDPADDTDMYYTRLGQIFELIEQLPASQRTILKLHALKKLTYAEIARRQGISINTVRTQLTRAYRRLRQSATGTALLALLDQL